MENQERLVRALCDGKDFTDVDAMDLSCGDPHNGGNQVRMRDGTRLPVGAPRLQQVHRAIAEYWR